jgi:hypothetical protein
MQSLFWPVGFSQATGARYPLRQTRVWENLSADLRPEMPLLCTLASPQNRIKPLLLVALVIQTLNIIIFS